jgi:hypothetical protein
MAESTTFIALVSFERTNDATDYLPAEAQGACGYMAVTAADEDEARDSLASELRQVNLHLLAIDEVFKVELEDLPDGIDEHLVQNMRTWEQGKRTVWGTIFTYASEGEA